MNLLSSVLEQVGLNPGPFIESMRSIWRFCGIPFEHLWLTVCVLADPATLHAFLDHLTEALIAYVCFQIESGAQVGRKSQS